MLAQAKYNSKTAIRNKLIEIKRKRHGTFTFFSNQA
jgi:hypothetical protein